ncbi:MAG TPA: AAA family ATPase [Bacillota bacterium]|nr:AAA family ATPase [Bacillota bacterium]
MILKPIHFSYKKQKDPLLKDVRLRLEKGRLNVLIGTNGAGKTTLLDILCGLHDVKGFESPFPKDEVVYQLQGMYLPPMLKGKDLVRLILKTDAPRQSFSRLTEQFNEKLAPKERQRLEKLWDVKYGDMSVGERRWLIIRSVTQLNRKLYVFDEPTAGVDPASRPYIIDALEQLAMKEDVYVLMSTHILHELAHVKSFISFLHEGNMAFEGDYEAFLKEYNSENPDIAFQNFLELRELHHYQS